MQDAELRRELTEAFDRYGMTAAVHHGETVQQTKAFIQPMTRESGDEPFAPTPIGAADEHCWRYLGPAGVAVEMGDRVVSARGSYTVRDAMAFYAGDEVIYHWAMLAKEEEA